MVEVAYVRESRLADDGGGDGDVHRMGSLR